MSNYELIEASRFTESGIQPPVEDNSRFDIVARLYGSTLSKTAHLSVVNTETLVSRWTHFMAEKQADVDALLGVVNWQHRVIDFNSTYVAYLLEQIDEEEFERAAEQIANEQRERAPEEITPLIDRILSLTQISYTPSDFANMFECSPDVVTRALKTLAVTHPTIQHLICESDE